MLRPSNIPLLTLLSNHLITPDQCLFIVLAASLIDSIRLCVSQKYHFFAEAVRDGPKGAQRKNIEALSKREADRGGDRNWWAAV